MPHRGRGRFLLRKRPMQRWKHRMLFAVCTPLSALQIAVALAGPYDPPASYYNSATGTGATLKSQLHNIIDNHTIRSYDAARTILQDTDVDPNNPNNMILVYDRVSIVGSNLSSWNREHTWPKSRGVETNGGPDGSDLHQLRPSTISVNSDRGHLNFGGVFGAQGFGSVFDKGAEVWYPGDADAGMIARQQFYMAVRYDGSDSGTEDLELVAGNPGIHGTVMGDKDRLIEWHYEAVPDDFELRRNDVIYDSYQFNRNAFIDRPEFVWSVYVDQQNDSQIAIAGAAVGGDGSTGSTVDLGRVLVGAATPTAQTVSINKNGNDGTYFQISTTGAATSSLGGRYNAFRTGGTDSTTIDVGLNTSTAAAGLRSGAVTINNLDVTTAGGAGRGANDADDTISMSLDVVDHANASFASGSDLNTWTHDFGSIAVGTPMPTFDFDLFNLVDTTSFTADLELDSFSGIGDTTVLTTDLAPLQGGSALEAGLSSMFTATLDTSTLGAFSATYTLSFSDEDLPGASSLGDLTLTLMGTVETATLAGDFDEDGDVDGADFLAWQRGFDNPYNADDLANWEANFGFTGTVAASTTGTGAAVPEPTALVLLGMGLAIAPIGRRRRRKRSA